MSAITHRRASVDDAPLLGALNHQLIADEGHRNPMTVEQLTARMRDWLRAGEYEATLFSQGDEVIAYALHRREPEHVYLRQFFVCRERRREGVGRRCVDRLLSDVWPPIPVRLDVLTTNEAGARFWRAVGFADYCLTLERPAAISPSATGREA